MELHTSSMSRPNSAVSGMRVAHVSSTFYGGGVTELPLTLMMNAMGIDTEQKSLREGFGPTVTEAMWKGAAVIGGDVGGIRHQIKDGWNGFLVKTPDEAAVRIVQVLKNPQLREQLGSRARATVREKFLMSRLLEDWLDLLIQFGRPEV